MRLAEVEVGDETGVVSLRARDQQIDALQAISDRSGAVVLRNCSLELYQGKHMRLAVTKWGKLTPYPDNVASTPTSPSKMNRERNFSLIDLTVVASESPRADVPNKRDNSIYSNDGGPRGHHTGGGRGHHRGQKPHQRQIRHSPPMMPAMHTHFMDPSNQQYASGGAMHYDARFALPPQHQYYSPTGQNGSPMAQQMMYNASSVRRETAPSMRGGYAPGQRSLHDPMQHSMFLAQTPHRHSMDTDGSSPDHAYGLQQDSNNMQSPSNMNPQAATFDPSLYPSYHAL